MLGATFRGRDMNIQTANNVVLSIAWRRAQLPSPRREFTAPYACHAERGTTRLVKPTSCRAKHLYAIIFDMK